jgi:hypothetical protein
VKPQAKGEAHYFRFADDFLACFENREDARGFRQRLEDRLEGFGLQVAEDKTRSIEFGRFARENARKRGAKPEEFTFLGFTHYCGKTRQGYFKVKRRTSRKKLGAGLREFTDWAYKGALRNAQGRNAASSQASGNRTSELLRHNGQLGKVLLLRLSHDTDFVQMA